MNLCGPHVGSVHPNKLFLVSLSARVSHLVLEPPPSDGCAPPRVFVEEDAPGLGPPRPDRWMATRRGGREEADGRLAERAESTAFGPPAFGDAPADDLEERAAEACVVDARWDDGCWFRPLP